MTVVILVRRCGVAVLVVLVAVVGLASACAGGKLDAQECRETYLHLPGRERLEREPGSQAARDEAAADMLRFVDEHPECRP